MLLDPKKKRLLSIAMQLANWGPLAGYRLTDIILGSGATSIVLAIESKDSSRSYALKVIEESSVDSKRFQEAAQLQYELAEQCPYIVRILFAKELWIKEQADYTIGLISDTWLEGSFSLRLVLMERLTPIVTSDGRKNISFVRTALLEQQEKMKLTMEIGMALLAVHRANGLHRDIKLENIFWSESEDVYKLGDFGASRRLSEGDAETIVFTDGYAAPEILQAGHAKYGRSADIYSFGMTLYLLWNRFCFPGSNGYTYSQSQYDPDFVFPAPIDSIEGLPQILRKMCSFRIKDRYQQMEEVLSTFAVLLEPTKEIEFTIPTEEFETVYAENAGESEEEALLYRTARKRDLSKLQKKHVRFMMALFLPLTIGLLLLYGYHVQETDTAHSFQLWILAFAIGGYGICKNHIPYLKLVQAGLILFGAVCFYQFLVLQVTASLDTVCSPLLPAVLAISILTQSQILTISSSIVTVIWMSMHLLYKVPFSALISCFQRNGAVRILHYLLLCIFIAMAIIEERYYQKELRYIVEKKYETTP